MRQSRFFGVTLRETPADADLAGHQLLLRGAFIAPLAAGIYSFLPLGERVKSKVEAIMREQMNAVDGQEVSMPVVHPAELWQETGRWQSVGPALVRFKDRGDRDVVLAMTHEEVVTDLLRRNVRSYRQLPVVMYQIQTKFRDEPRARGGLIRAREFVMKDAYSCHATVEDLDTYYPRMYAAYFRIFHRSGLDVLAVESDVGMMGGTAAHEFMFVNSIGEDQLVLCSKCGYAANRQVATFRKPEPPLAEPKPVEEVETPGIETIAALARFLEIPESKTAKATFFMDGDRLIFAVVRGDMEVNETKLANAVGAAELRPAGPEDLRAAGIVAGYASPIGVEGVRVVVDDLAAASPNLVAGANKPGYHLLNTNVPRDYTPDVVTDIVAVTDGMPCAVCGGELELVRGVELGNTFKLGTRYSAALGATYLDEHGKSHDIVMASYGIGVGRLIACVAEEHHDERGLCWPVTIAPYEVHLIGLDLTDDGVRQAAESLYQRLQDAGVEVLFDDRAERAGVKFNDADLIGIPLRLTVSRRTVANNAAELKRRIGSETEMVPAAGAVERTRSELGQMRQEILEQVDRDRG